MVKCRDSLGPTYPPYSAGGVKWITASALLIASVCVLPACAVDRTLPTESRLPAGMAVKPVSAPLAPASPTLIPTTQDDLTERLAPSAVPTANAAAAPGANAQAEAELGPADAISTRRQSARLEPAGASIAERRLDAAASAEKSHRPAEPQALDALFDGSKPTDDLDVRLAALPPSSPWHRLPKAVFRLADGVNRRPNQLPWSLKKRAAAFGAVVAVLVVAPVALHPFSALHGSAHSISHLLLWPSGLMGHLAVPGAVALAAATHALRPLVDRLHYWALTRSDPEKMRRLFADMFRTPVVTTLELGIAAWSEELIFRLTMILGLTFALAHVLPWDLAYAAAALLSSLPFAFSHGYGSVWPRVVDHLLYAGTFAVTGSIGVAALAHFLSNWFYMLLYAAQRATGPRPPLSGPKLRL